MNDSPKLFRVTLEVADLEAATVLYVDLLAQSGQRRPGAGVGLCRHTFDSVGGLVQLRRRGRPLSLGALAAQLSRRRPRTSP